MSYGKNLNINVQTGEVIEEVIDNAWILARKPDQLLLSLDKSQIAGDGLDKAIISVQRVTPPLVDSTQNTIASPGSVSLLVDDEVITIDLDETGAGSLEITSVEAGVFPIQGEEMASNLLTLEVI